MATPGIEIESLVFASDRAVRAFWKFIEEEKITNLKHTNEVIGAYFTTGSRIHLYKYLDRLQAEYYIAIPIQSCTSRKKANPL
jgi:hypothetical protein